MPCRQPSLLKQVLGGAALVAASLVMGLAGCDQQDEQKVFDLEAPGVDIEVMESGDDQNRRIEIETAPDTEQEP